MRLLRLFCPWGILCCCVCMSFCGAWWVNFLVTWLNYHDSLKACEEVPLFKGNYQTLSDFYSYLTSGTKPTRYYGKENVKTFIQNEHCKTTNDPGCGRYIDSTDWPPFLNHDIRAGPHKNTSRWRLLHNPTQPKHISNSTTECDDANSSTHYWRHPATYNQR